MVNGRCLCGEISYTLSGEILYLYNCHCRECRAFSGSSYATNALIITQDLQLSDPGNNLGTYDFTSGRRHFCSRCSSPLYSVADSNAELTALHCGGITTALDKKPEINLWVSEKCSWVEIDQTHKNYAQSFE